MGEALQKYAERYTVADRETWKDSWELIHGFPYCMSPAPSYRHQDINAEIISELRTQLRACEKCKAMMPIDWQIDEETVVEPDVSVICKPVTGKKLLFAPTAIFEILSPSTERKDRTVKFELYQAQRVKYYVLVDPENEKAELFLLDEEGIYQAIPTSETLHFDFEGCAAELNMREIWARL